jgi:hypothetical protein
MTYKEIINRNIGLTFDFLHQVVNDPSMLSKIPNGTTLEFVEKDFSKIEGRKKIKSRRKYFHIKSGFELI